MRDYEPKAYELYGHHTITVLCVESDKYVATSYDNKQIHCWEGKTAEEALGGCIRLISADDVKRNGGDKA